MSIIKGRLKEIYIMEQKKKDTLIGYLILEIYLYIHIFDCNNIPANRMTEKKNMSGT